MSLVSVEDRLLTIDREFDELKQECFERKPSAKSGRQAVGAILDDEFSKGTRKPRREWEEQANRIPAALTL
jgi:hypothetical protein